MSLSIVKVFLPAALAFITGLLITPLFTHYFYKYKLWKKSSRSSNNVDEMNEHFKRIHNETEEQSTPRVGGIIIWFTAFAIITIFAALPYILPSDVTVKLNFLSREQTLVPLAALLLASLLGLGDDIIQIFGTGSFAKDATNYRMIKIITLLIIGLGVSWWFYTKLGMNSIHVPFGGTLYLGIFFIPFFIAIMLAVFSGSVIDGIDGQAGGVLAAIFLAYAAIAFGKDQIDLAAFSAVLGGATLAFLWFNIPPARFWLGETGMIGLCVTIAILAFMTDTVLLLPIIAFPLAATSLSVIIQMISKKFFGKRVFKLAPLHHHFEAIGWPRTKIAMRYWVVSIMCAVVGIIISLVS